MQLTIHENSQKIQQYATFLTQMSNLYFGFLIKYSKLPKGGHSQISILPGNQTIGRRSVTEVTTRLCETRRLVYAIENHGMSVVIVVYASALDGFKYVLLV